MDYNFDFDIAAFVILITILVHNKLKKDIRTFQTKCFHILVYTVIVYIIADLLSIPALESQGEYALSYCYFINIFRMTMSISTCMAFLTYYLSLIKRKDQITVSYILLMFIPGAVSIILTILSPITNMIFYYDDNHIHQHGNWHFIVYLVVFFYIIAIVVLILGNSTIFTHSQIISTYYFMIICSVGVLIQFIFPRILTAALACAIACIINYISLKNPQQFEDASLETYNYNAFVNIVENTIRQHKLMNIVGIRLCGFEELSFSFKSSDKEELYRQITELIQKMIPDRCLFRLTTNRFAIVTMKNEINTFELCETLKERFSNPFRYSEMDIVLNAIFCRLNYPQNADNINDILNTFDYCFKTYDDGRSSHIINVDEKLTSKIKRSEQIVRKVSNAIKNESFILYYQPILSVEQNKYISAEALVRLPDDDFGMIYPDEFINDSEKDGTILKIGEIVFRKACEFMVSSDACKYGIEYLEVNLSAVQCMQDTLHTQLIKIMDLYGLKHNRINLEITESATYISSEVLSKNMNNLIKSGVSFSLDDYGTGYSSISHIIAFPFKIIKIDKCIVWAAMDNDRGYKTLKHTMSMIKDLNILILAEGIENNDQADTLRNMGCDYFQGYLYSKPLSGNDFIEFIKNSNVKKA